MKSCKFCWSISALFLIAIGAMTYFFVIKGSTTEGSDGRTAVLISDSERNLLLGEMRQFLETVQSITEALSENDMKTVREEATKVGSVQIGTIPLPLMAKLPVDFKKLGFDTHGVFDAIAASAQDGAKPEVVLTKVSLLLNNCTTCHAGYRMDVEGGASN